MEFAATILHTVAPLLDIVEAIWMNPRAAASTWGFIKSIIRLTPRDSGSEVEGSNDYYLKVWDLAISGPDAASPVAEIGPSSQPHDTLSLRTQGEDTIRVFIYEGYTCDRLEALVGIAYRLPPWSIDDEGYHTLMSQWRTNGTSWSTSQIADYLVRRQPGPRVFDRFWMGSGITLRVVRVLRALLMKDTNDDRQVVFIRCSVFGRSSTSAASTFSTTVKFSAELIRLDTTYIPLRTRANWKQLFALQYYHATLNIFRELLQRLTHDYHETRKRKYDPREFTLRQWIVKEITANSILYQELKNSGNEITTTMETLIDLLDISINAGTQRTIAPTEANGAPLEAILSLLQTVVEKSSQPPGDFSVLSQELRGCCKDVDARLSRLCEDLEHDLRFLELSRSMSQAISTQQLTIFAALFLPMSLATGILSMGTRFADLGPLLYDFFGVLALIITFVFLIWIGLALFAAVMERSGIMQSMWVKNLRWSLLGGLAFMFAVYGCLVLTSFLVGMFLDLPLGGQILGYGTAVFVGIPPAIVLSWAFIVKVKGRIEDSKMFGGKMRQRFAGSGSANPTALADAEAGATEATGATGPARPVGPAA